MFHTYTCSNVLDFQQLISRSSGEVQNQSSLDRLRRMPWGRNYFQVWTKSDHERKTMAFIWTPCACSLKYDHRIPWHITIIFLVFLPSTESFPSWWFFHPFEKYARQNWIISPGIGVSPFTSAPLQLWSECALSPDAAGEKGTYTTKHPGGPKTSKIAAKKEFSPMTIL